MLVLSRQKDESVIIGDDVEIRVVDLRGDKVRLGISAPRDVSVHRKEVYEAIRRENQSAAQVLPHEVPIVPAPAPPLRMASESKPAVLSSEHAAFLQAAIDEATLGRNEGGVPIGAVLVRDGRIIGRGHNRRVQQGDPMAHAEIDCLKNAGRQKTYRDATLYSTLMPCFLCAGAILQFGIPKVVVGESINFPGGHCRAVRSPDLLRRCGVEVVDLNDSSCIALMRQFMAENPTLWNEDIGHP